MSNPLSHSPLKTTSQTLERLNLMANEVQFKMTFSGDQLTQEVWNSAFPSHLQYQDFADYFDDLPFIKSAPEQKNSIGGLRCFDFSSTEFIINGVSTWEEPSVLFEMIVSHLIEVSGGPVYALMTYREQFDHFFGTSCLITKGDELESYSKISSSDDYEPALIEAFPRCSEDSFRWDLVNSTLGISAEDFVEFQVDKIISEQKRQLLARLPMLSALVNPQLILEKRLRYQRGTSDKVYYAYLSIQDDGYIVTAQYGRRNAAKLSESIKTKSPVPLAEAEKIFYKLLRSKTVKGYRDERYSGGVILIG